MGSICISSLGGKATALVLFLALSLPASTGDTLHSEAEPLRQWIVDNVELIPEYHVDADMRWFYNQTCDYFRTHYFIESTIKIELLLLAIKERGLVGCTFEVTPGMGQTPRNVFFDPMDIHYAWIPFLEGRFGSIEGQMGIDHRCFHEVDRKDFPTVYWNELFLAAQSTSYRYKPFWQSNAHELKSFRDRFGWRVQWGYFLREFGNVKPSNINFENHRVHETNLHLRYLLERSERLGAAILTEATVGFWRDLSGPMPIEEGYWRLELSPEATVLNTRHGWVFFFLFTLDDIPSVPGAAEGRYAGTMQPRFSRNKLIQFGVRMFM
ncbi:MAG: hypothetical protein GF344_00120 [Chitinivibrionales bacterium]|nr:hypothetical protein [Chitinivibrionales bacterium]